MKRVNRNTILLLIIQKIRSSKTSSFIMATTAGKNVDDYVPESQLEQKIAEAIQGIISEEGRKKPKLARVQLQFPKAAASFKAMKNAFDKYDADKDGTIDLEEITNALKDLGDSFHAEEVHGLFDIAADAEGSKSLTFPGFVVFLCLSSLLGHLSDSMEEINAAFRCAVDAFDVFDVKNKGVIVFSELNEAFSAGSTPDILMARMEELDKDGNGFVIFPEFLVAFMDWVGVDEDDDDE